MLAHQAQLKNCLLVNCSLGAMLILNPAKLLLVLLDMLLLPLTILGA